MSFIYFLKRIKRLQENLDIILQCFIIFFLQFLKVIYFVSVVVMIFFNFYKYFVQKVQGKLNLEVGKDGDIVDLWKKYLKMFRYKRKKFKGKI